MESHRSHKEPSQEQKWHPVEIWMVAVFLSGIMEGALRKWVLPHSIPELGYVAYLSKDIVFGTLGILISARFTTPLLENYSRYLQLLLLLFVTGAAGSMIQQLNIVGALLNFRSMFFLPLFAYFAARLLLTRQIIPIVRGVALLTFIPAGLSIIQFLLPNTHPINTYVDPSMEVIVFDGIVRATGTFAFISGMSSMTILAVWAGMFLQTASHTMGDVFLGRAAVLAGLVCGSTSMTRAGLFISVAIIIGVFLLSGMKRVFLVPVVLLMALGTIAMPQGAEDNVVNPYVTLVSTVMERHAKSDSVMDRFDSMNQYLIQSIFEEPMGNGFGVGQVGGAYFATGERKFLRYEQELPRMVSEIGIVGTLGVLMLRIWIIWTLMQACWRLPVGTGQSGLLVCTLSILAFFMQNTAFDHVASGFVWPMLAISLAWAEQQSYLAKQIHQ